MMLAASLVASVLLLSIGYWFLFSIPQVLLLLNAIMLAVSIHRDRVNHQRYLLQILETNKDRCIICWDEHPQLAILECYHVFCLDCLTEHGEKWEDCPICREPFSSCYYLCDGKLAIKKFEGECNY
jgi:hypothetical protein